MCGQQSSQCWAFTAVSPTTTTSTACQKRQNMNSLCSRKIPCVRAVRVTNCRDSNSREALALQDQVLAPLRSLLVLVSIQAKLRWVADMRLIMKRIACLCVLLICWSAIASTTHQHSNATESATCKVCIAAHSTSPKTTFTSVRVTFVGVSAFRAEPVSAKQRATPFALLVRPPPAI